MLLDEVGEKRLKIGSKRNRHASSDCKLLLLLLQQLAFPLDAPTVPAETAVLLHDTVAGDDEADVIGGARTRDGADGARRANRFRDVSTMRSGHCSRFRFEGSCSGLP